MKVVFARGSAFEMGQVVGRSAVAVFRTLKAPPVSEDVARAFARQAWAATRARYPLVAREIEGIADGAQVPLELVVLGCCQELWDPEDMRPAAGCTDIVVRGPASAAGTTLLAHTNDADAHAVGPAVIHFVPTDGRPASTGVTMDGYAPAVGRNEAGIVLTGNSLVTHDVKPGVPRLVLARATLDQLTLEAAIDVCLDPERAATYNNILADGRGRVIDLEGSATRAAVVPFEDDVLVHTNHYLLPEMTDLERKWNQSSTRMRMDVATELARRGRPHTVESLAAILASHEGAPDCICRHGDDDVRTFFATIYEAETGRAWVADGLPCYAPWRPLPTAPG